jgi:hypothetical protein
MEQRESASCTANKATSRIRQILEKMGESESVSGTTKTKFCIDTRMKCPKNDPPIVSQLKRKIDEMMTSAWR